MNIFSGRTGNVTLIPDAGYPLAIGLQGWPGSPAMRSCLTQLGVSKQANYQFMQTLRDFVYIYTFGNKIADLQLGGVSFPGICLPGGSVTGFELLDRYYQTFTLANRGAPVVIAIGTTLSFSGWLVGLTNNILDPMTGMSQFQLAFKFFQPRRR